MPQVRSITPRSKQIISQGFLTAYAVRTVIRKHGREHMETYTSLRCPVGTFALAYLAWELGTGKMETPL